MGGTIYEKLKTDGGLPTPPGVVLRLLELTRSDESSLSDVVKAIETDPSLAARLMKFANSPLAGQAKQVTTLQQAAVMLGMRGITMMALSLSILTPPIEKPCPKFKTDQFRLQSLACGVAARILAASTKYEPPQEAFLAGLLSQIGRSVFAIGLKKDYNKLLGEVEGVPADLPPAELRVFGDTYPGIGAQILSDWGIPDHIVEGVRRFRALDGAKEEAPLLSRILHVSEIIAAIICPLGRPPSVDEYCDALKAHLFIDAAHGATFIHASTIEFEMLRLAFEMPDKGVVSGPELEAAVRSRVAELSMVTFMESQQRRATDADLLKRATTDPLTRIANRAAFDERLDLEVERAKRTLKPLAVVMMDVDHFKLFNDNHGHLAGDEVLKTVAETLKDTVRTVDFAARYGGEEFTAIAPEMSPEGVETFAERLRRAIDTSVVTWEGKPLKVTVSIGINLVSKNFGKMDGRSMIKAADELMYDSKKAGRNRFHIRVDGERLKT